MCSTRLATVVLPVVCGCFGWCGRCSAEGPAAPRPGGGGVAIGGGCSTRPWSALCRCRGRRPAKARAVVLPRCCGSTGAVGPPLGCPGRRCAASPCFRTPTPGRARSRCRRSTGCATETGPARSGPTGSPGRAGGSLAGMVGRGERRLRPLLAGQQQPVAVNGDGDRHLPGAEPVAVAEAAIVVVAVGLGETQCDDHCGASQGGCLGVAAGSARPKPGRVDRCRRPPR